MKQITVEDFDNAVKQPHSYGSCILSQTAERLYRHRWFFQRPFIRAPYWTDVADQYVKAWDIVTTFDRFFRTPGDENKPELRALRASLPITLE